MMIEAALTTRAHHNHHSFTDALKHVGTTLTTIAHTSYTAEQYKKRGIDPAATHHTGRVSRASFSFFGRFWPLTLRWVGRAAADKHEESECGY